jgi:hypothetical protein
VKEGQETHFHPDAPSSAAVRLGTGKIRRDWQMRIVLTVAVIVVSVALGGCFHHHQSYAVETLPPPAPPLK